MLYLTRLFITTNDSSSWMVSWWTVVRLYQSYRLLQRRNALPVSPNTTYPLQTHNAFVPSVAEMRDSSSPASIVPMTWLLLTWSIQSSAWTSFKMEKANAASLIYVDTCLADRYTMEEFPMDNKTVLGFFADFCNSCAKSLSLRIQGTEQHKQHG